MTPRTLAAIAVFALTGTALAQTPPGNNQPPASIGNRANGLDYQPTPNEIVPREKAAGVLPPAAQERAIDQELRQLDYQALKSEGMSTQSVPPAPQSH